MANYSIFVGREICQHLDVETYLKTKGIEATQRTIQRDLNLLETLFPLECRRDCMPYSWRWKKGETVVVWHDVIHTDHPI